MIQGLASILPILTAGFLFIVTCYKTRLLSTHAEGQRLFFMCAASGLVVAAIAHALLEWNPCSFLNFISDSDMRQRVLTFVLGPLLAVFVNLIYMIRYLLVDAETRIHASTPWEWVISRHESRSDNPFRRMLVQAAESNGEKLILVSLASRKVYCGAMRRLSAKTMGDEYIEIIPMFSATRDKDTLAFVNRIEYPVFHIWRIKRRIELLEKLKEIAPYDSGDREAIEEELVTRKSALTEIAARAPAGYADNLDIDLWSKVIPAREVESLSFYDIDGNTAWFKRESEESDKSTSFSA